MGIIRGKIYHPKINPRIHEVNGPSPWIKCKCGKWLDRETLKHVEVETLTLKELFTRFEIPCPDKED